MWDEGVDMHKILSVLSQLREQIKNNKLLSEKKKKAFDGKLEAIMDEYQSLEDINGSEELLSSLIKNGTDLQNIIRKSKDRNEVKEKVQRYIRYVQAAVYDLKGDISGINRYTRTFILMTALFMVLTPQFYGFILPLVFAIPIFSGLKGIKKRNRTAFLLTLSVVPMSLMTGITWIQYLLKKLMVNYTASIQAIASDYKLSQTAAGWITSGACAFGVVLVGLSIITAYQGYKYRDMFV